MTLSLQIEQLNGPTWDGLVQLRPYLANQRVLVREFFDLDFTRFDRLDQHVRPELIDYGRDAEVRGLTILEVTDA